MCGVTFNYFFNRLWTFSSNDPQIMLQYSKFALIGIIGLLIVNGIVYFLHSRNNLPFFFSKVMAMIVFMFWNFTANYFYTFG
jgi:putative flippase GtrA